MVMKRSAGCLMQSRKNTKAIADFIGIRIMGEGSRRELDSGLDSVLKWIQAAFALYVIAAVVLYPHQILHRGICFGFFTALAFIRYSSPGSTHVGRVPVHDWIMAMLSLSVSVYICVELERFLGRFPFADPVLGADVFFGVTAIILMLESTRRIIGPWLSILSIMALVYIFMGPWIPGMFSHPGYRPNTVIDELFMTTDGIFGSTLGVASNQILVFILFGAFLVKSGIGAYLYDLASFIAGRSRGGIAKAAILTSAFFGMISGSPVANVSSMGIITIPMMKKRGYPSDFAAALESCASVGGIFMPPVMGSVAFIMAEVGGFSYREVALSALLPAFFYYMAIFLAIDMRSARLMLQGTERDPDITWGSLARRGAGYLLPIVFLVVRIVAGISPARVGIESIAVIIIASLIFNKNRIGFGTIVQALSDGMRQGIMIVTTMAACGIMIGVINLTGISAKFSSMLLSVAGESLALALILAMLLAVFLGLAMNITPAYLLTAVVAAPVMINLGVTPMAAHLFIVFYAAMATITPPVAMTAFAAAAIADAPPMRVGFQAMRIGFAAYILPFAFVMQPALLLGAGAADILYSIVAGAFAILFFVCGMEGWCRGSDLNPVSRIVFIIAGVLGLFGGPIILALSVLLAGGGYLISNRLPGEKSIDRTEEL